MSRNCYPRQRVTVYLAFMPDGDVHVHTGLAGVEERVRREKGKPAAFVDQVGNGKYFYCRETGVSVRRKHFMMRREG